MREAAPDESPGARRRGAGRGRTALAAGLVLSVGLHVLLVGTVVFPAPDPPRSATEWTFRDVPFPPRVEVPDPPAAVRRPPPPSIPQVRVESPALTGRAGASPPARPPAPEPPPVRLASTRGDPTLARREVPPLLETSPRFRERLRRSYRDVLEIGEVEGMVRVRFFVDARGEVSGVEVSESSGHRRLDRLARELVRETEFRPALNRDRATGVWVTQPICFVVLDRAGEEAAVRDCDGEVTLGGE